MCLIVGDKNVTRARPEFLKRLKFVQGDADDFTVRNTLHVFEVVVSVYRGRKSGSREGFTDVDLRVLKSILGDLKIPADAIFAAVFGFRNERRFFCKTLRSGLRKAAFPM